MTPHGSGLYAYDLAVIGSGGGAFAAAIAARRKDLRVVMVEAGTGGKHFVPEDHPDEVAAAIRSVVDRVGG